MVRVLRLVCDLLILTRAIKIDYRSKDGYKWQVPLFPTRNVGILASDDGRPYQFLHWCFELLHGGA